MNEFSGICDCGSDVGVRDCCGRCVSHCDCEVKGQFLLSPNAREASAQYLFLLNLGAREAIGQHLCPFCQTAWGSDYERNCCPCG